jgi:hypothetical protein
MSVVPKAYHRDSKVDLHAYVGERNFSWVVGSELVFPSSSTLGIVRSPWNLRPTALDRDLIGAIGPYRRRQDTANPSISTCRLRRSWERERRNSIPAKTRAMHTAILLTMLAADANQFMPQLCLASLSVAPFTFVESR